MAERADASLAAPIELLPDALVARVLEELGLELALSARTVCRQWRAAAASIEWRRISFAAGGPPRLRSITALVSGGGPPLRLAAVESFRLDLSSAWKPPAVHEALAAAVPLMAAVAAASARLREAEVEYGTIMPASFDAVVAMIAALARRGGTLRALSLRGNAAAALARACHAAAAEALEAALGPLSGLERLALPPFLSLDANATAAVARSLPRLQSATLTLQTPDDVRGLAPLSALASLCLRARFDGSGDGLAALAAGPAGRSLRELALEFAAVLRGPDLRALPLLERLERLEAAEGCTITVSTGAEAADLAALRTLQRLQVLSGLELAACGPERLEALAEALAGMRRLRVLDLRLDLSGGRVDEAVAAPVRRILACAGPVLCRLSVACGPCPAPRTLPADVAGAAYPRLRELHYEAALAGGGRDAAPLLAPLAAIGPKLRLTARLLPCGNLKAAAADLRAALAGALPEAYLSVLTDEY